ncbi:MAG TPA: ester cyclase [Anaerolineales bacterium]|nr:ester cyclase [Anaerolineales bacterium]HLE30738.1 ester cyclase [Anaerolineales bacterium]
MSTEENEAIVRRYREIHNKNQLDQLGEVLAADFVGHALLPGAPSGLEGAKMVHLGGLAAFPDAQVTTEDLIAEGDKVVERWTQTMTHTGVSMFGAPTGSGKKVKITGISIYRIASGKIVEHWSQMDVVSILQQLGVMPAPGGS